jgi:hypothetical protein
VTGKRESRRLSWDTELWRFPGSPALALSVAVVLGALIAAGYYVLSTHAVTTKQNSIAKVSTARNETLLATVPIYRGAKRISDYTNELTDTSVVQRTTGYVTEHTFKLPARATGRAVADFYYTQLHRRGWRGSQLHSRYCDVFYRRAKQQVQVNTCRSDDVSGATFTVSAWLRLKP